MAYLAKACRPSARFVACILVLHNLLHNISCIFFDDSACMHPGLLLSAFRNKRHVDTLLKNVFIRNSHQLFALFLDNRWHLPNSKFQKYSLLVCLVRLKCFGSYVCQDVDVWLSKVWDSKGKPKHLFFRGQPLQSVLRHKVTTFCFLFPCFLIGVG